VTITVITVGVSTVTVDVTSKGKIAVYISKGRRGVAPLILNNGTG